MDTNPHDTPLATGADAGGTAGRRKLWQLDSACRERLIRACLSPRELKSLCRKLRIEVQPPEVNALRRALVEVSGAPSATGRRLHKYLDRKYWPTILRFTGAPSTTALAALWRQTATGEAPDACWALATHPHASPWLIGQVHRETHDPVGAGGHAIGIDEQTLDRLQRPNAAFPAQRSPALPAMTMQLSAAGLAPGVGTPAAAEESDTSPQASALQEMESRLLSLRTQVEDYAAKLALERMRAERAEASASEWRQRAILYAAGHRPRGSAHRTRNLRSQTDGVSAGGRPRVHGTG